MLLSFFLAVAALFYFTDRFNFYFEVNAFAFVGIILGMIGTASLVRADVQIIYKEGPDLPIFNQLVKINESARRNLKQEDAIWWDEQLNDLWEAYRQRKKMNPDDDTPLPKASGGNDIHSSVSGWTSHLNQIDDLEYEIETTKEGKKIDRSDEAIKKRAKNIGLKYMIKN